MNIKILLGGAVADGELTVDDRDELLAEMTDEVADAGAAGQLRPGDRAGRPPGRSRGSLLPVHRRMITRDGAGRPARPRRSRRCPRDEDLAARGGRGIGLTSPELAVLLAYTKIILEREINESPLPDEAWTRRCWSTTSRRRCGSATPIG